MNEKQDEKQNKLKWIIVNYIIVSQFVTLFFALTVSDTDLRWFEIFQNIRDVFQLFCKSSFLSPKKSTIQYVLKTCNLKKKYYNLNMLIHKFR